MPKKNSAGKTGRFLIVTVIALITLGASAVAGYTWYQLKKVETKLSPTATAQQPAAAAPLTAPVYLPLETFTVSLKPGAEEDRVLYIGITLRLADEKSRTLLEAFLPEVRSRLLVLLSQQTAEYMATDEGKASLRQQIKSELSKPVSDRQKAGITDVLYNAFILR